ncbi:hypothetical protein ACJX0J_010082, partial [Zea mays]
MNTKLIVIIMDAQKPGFAYLLSYGVHEFLWLYFGAVQAFFYIYGMLNYFFIGDNKRIFVVIKYPTFVGFLDIHAYP